MVLAYLVIQLIINPKSFFLCCIFIYSSLESLSDTTQMYMLSVLFLVLDQLHYHSTIPISLRISTLMTRR